MHSTHYSIYIQIDTYYTLHLIILYVLNAYMYINTYLQYMLTIGTTHCYQLLCNSAL